MIRVGQMMNLNNIWTNWTIYITIRDLIFPWIAPNTLKFLDSSTDLSWLSRIRWIANQPRIKYIYLLYISTKTSPSLSQFIHVHLTLLHDSI